MRQKGASQPGFTRLRPAMAGLRRGFTMIELIIVVAMIAIVVSAVFVAVDPARRLSATRNTSRWTDARAILEAIKTYQVDHGGSLPRTSVAIDSLSESVQLIGNSTSSCEDLASFCPGVSFPKAQCYASGLKGDLTPYLKRLPVDPGNGSPADTRYYVNRNSDGLIVVGACDEEGEGERGKGEVPVIEVSR
ncbi:MAG: type II secretion system protein [Patescibacteria group bacterium]